MSYIVTKASRAPDVPKDCHAYRGPTCAHAGIEPGKVYRNRVDARDDARLLSQYNPVGFLVLEIGKPWPDCITDQFEHGHVLSTGR